MVDGLNARRILDIGAGSGFFSRHLLAEAGAQSALCVDIGYPSDRDDSEGGKPVLYRRDTGPTDCDLVLMMDVLEHVDDDRGLVRHYAAKVPSGAISWRRYRPSASCGAATTSSSSTSGAIAWARSRRRCAMPACRSSAAPTISASSFPWQRAVRLATRGATEPRSSLKKHGALTNGILATVCAAELPLLPVNRLAGLSAFVLARKP